MVENKRNADNAPEKVLEDESMSGLSVYDSADVLVIGGGFAGVCAALAAARAGASVMLTEKSADLGGQAAEIHTWGLDGFISSTGKQLIKGIPWEILQKNRGRGRL